MPKNIKTKNQEWLFEISSNKKLLEINLKEIWRFRDLMVLFVRRNIVSVYKQTILGPLWFFIQPIFTSLIQFVVFSKIADIQSDGVPYFLFVLAGNIMWGFFSTNLSASANTFSGNAAIFSKVYFPRAIMPITNTISGLFKFCIQFVLFISILMIVKFKGGHANPNLYALTLPFIILVLGLLSMGLGMVVTSMTTKYRDLNFLMSFALSLVMYMTPVIYPTSLLVEKVTEAGYPRWLAFVNPLTGLFDLFKYGFLGEGILSWGAIAWSSGFAIAVYFLGLVLFNRTEKTFIDTI